MVQFIWNDQRGGTGKTMRGRSGKCLVAPEPRVSQKPPERFVVVEWENENFDSKKLQSELFGLNWQLIELAS